MLLLTIVIILLVFITQTLFSYWWLIIPNAFLSALLLGKGSWSSFLAGFLGVGLVWFFKAYYANWQNEGLLSEKIALLLKLPSPEWLLLITVLIAALTAGFAALFGYSIRDLVERK